MNATLSKWKGWLLEKESRSCYGKHEVNSSKVRQFRELTLNSVPLNCQWQRLTVSRFSG